MCLKFTVCLLISVSIITAAYSQGFNSVFSKDGNLVWAVGSNGSVYYSATGGASWNANVIGSGNYNSVYSINQKVWVVGESGILQMSANGGNSWSGYTVSAQSLNSVFFIDENTGWSGAEKYILKTTNGGINWVQQFSIEGAPVFDAYCSIHFINSCIQQWCHLFREAEYANEYDSKGDRKSRKF